MSEFQKKASGLTFAFIMFLYIIVFPPILTSGILDDAPGWLLPFIVIPGGIAGLMIQVLGYNYIYETLRSWGVYQDKAGSVAVAIWLGFHIIYGGVLKFFLM